MTLKEYILESLGHNSLRIINEETTVTELDNKWFDLKKVVQMTHKWAESTGTLKTFVQSDQPWIDSLKKYSNSVLPFFYIKQLDEQTVKVIDDELIKSFVKIEGTTSNPPAANKKAKPVDENPPKEKPATDQSNSTNEPANNENAELHNEEGDYNKLNDSAKAIIDGRIFIDFIMEYANKICQVYINKPLFTEYEKYSTTTHNNGACEGALFLTKLIFAYLCNNFEPKFELHKLFETVTNSKYQMGDLERLILFTEVYISLRQVYAFDVKTLSYFLDALGIK